MKFLVTGSAGLVGTQIVNDLVKIDHQVFSAYHNAKPSVGKAITLDLENQQNIISAMHMIKPDVVIHLAAMTNVDMCETYEDLAMKINADATEVLARQAAKQSAFFLFVSTDYVFDGISGMKKESDKPNPLGVYGKSKLEGELCVQNLESRWAIARISTPFGIHPTKSSFPVWIKDSLESKKSINILIDQFTSPTYVPNLSQMLIEISTREITGVIHVSGATRISRFDFANLVCSRLGLDNSLLKPITMCDISWKAKRPKDSSLDITKASSILREKPQTIQKSLDLFINALMNA